MDNEEYKRKALEPIVNYIESVMASYSKEELEARIKKALPKKESEDERIRKRLVEYFNGFYDRFSSRNNVNVHWEGLEVKAVIAYLEKQKDASDAIEAVERIESYITANTANSWEMDNSDPRKKYYCGVDDVLVDISGILQGVYVKPKEQKPAEWSEEDEKMLSACIEAVGSMSVRSDVKTLRDWLRSLRPQPSWKPSEKQMKCLVKCVNRAREMYNASANGYDAYPTLSSLLHDLRSL